MSLVVRRSEQSLCDLGPPDPSEAKAFRAHAPLQVRAIISCMHSKSLVHVQIDLVDTIFEGLQEQSRLKITNEVRKFIEVGTTTRP